MGHMQEGQPTGVGDLHQRRRRRRDRGEGQAAGGTVVVEPMDVMDIGRMAFFTDPTGAVFGVWQPRRFAGADLVNEPNSLCWNEVLTRDAEAGKALLPGGLRLGRRQPAFEGAPDSYTVWELDGKPVGGMMQMTDECFPPEVPPHWSVCFAVADCDATVAKARELGGDDHRRADGHADRPLRGPDRSQGAFRGHADGIANVNIRSASMRA